MAESLPVEILNSIASFTRKADLLDLSLTSKDFHYATIPYIWEYINVRIGCRVERQRKVQVVQWSVGGSITPSKDRLRHVRRFEIKSLDSPIPYAEQAGVLERIAVCLRAMTRLEAFRFQHYGLLMMPCIIVSLREAQSLVDLSTAFAERDKFPTSAMYKETVKHLQQLKNLKIFEMGTNVFLDSDAARTAARILVNPPSLRVLNVSTHEFDSEDDPDDEHISRIRGILSKICTEYSKICHGPEGAVDSTARQESRGTRPRSARVQLLPMEHLTLDNACLLQPEIHLLDDTTYLKTLDVTNCDMEFGGDNPYDETNAALKVLAGRAPNLQSVTFDGAFCAHPDAQGVNLSHDLPSLSELVVWNLHESASFVEAMEACGGAGHGAQRWKRLVLAFGDSSMEHYMEEETFSHLIPFIAECTNLTHLDIVVYHTSWSKFVHAIEKLPHLRELHFYVDLHEGDKWPRSDSDIAKELFDCNSELNIVMPMTRYTKTPNRFWRRGQDMSYPLYDGQTKLLDFPPERPLS